MRQVNWTTVVDDIRQDIKQGRLKPGEKLPTIAQLCQRYGVPSIVVRNAMLALKAEGHVTGVPGVGVIVGVQSLPRRRPRCAWKAGHPRPRRAA